MEYVQDSKICATCTIVKSLEVCYYNNRKKRTITKRGKYNEDSNN